MGFIDTFSEVTGTVDDIATMAEFEAFVRRLMGAYEFKNAVYYMPGIPGQPGCQAVAVITYADEWMQRYYEADYLSIDPVVSEGFGSSLPVDWADLPRSSPRVRRMFGEALEAGVGQQGLTFPVRGRRGETALFSVTSDLPDKEWAKAKRTYVRDLQLVAHMLHDKALAVSGLLGSSPAPPRLSPRERECLTWCAMGKTSDDIATILGISEGVVRIHLQSAQNKLNCLNRTHAVAKALANRLIFPDIR